MTRMTDEQIEAMNGHELYAWDTPMLTWHRHASHRPPRLTRQPRPHAMKRTPTRRFALALLALETEKEKDDRYGHAAFY
jgi:hypothetical protein